MPRKPRPLCNRCRQPFDNTKTTRCPTCWPMFANSAWRGTINRRRWERVRRHVLAADPLCTWQGCVALAVEVDHVKNLKAHPEIDPYDQSNMQGLCGHHHAVKTGTEANRAARGKVNDE